MRFVDLLRATVMFCGAATTTMVVVTVLAAASEGGDPVVMAATMWWTACLLVGLLLSRRRDTNPAIGRLLAVEGATPADIVALDSFHVSKDLVADLLVFNEVRAQYMQAPHPAWTAIGVAALGIPGGRAEVKVTAFLGNASGGR